MENIETLYSTTKNREQAKSEDKKTNPGFSKSKSDERLDSQEAESREHVLTGRSASSASLDNGRPSVPSKYTSREAVVKSQKPTTKPLHLGKLYSKSRRRESYFASYYELARTFLATDDWLFCPSFASSRERRNQREKLSPLVWYVLVDKIYLNHGSFAITISNTSSPVKIILVHFFIFSSFQS